jgi:hypothetical protein
MSATPPAQVQIRVDWSAAERLPILAANLVLVQQTPHELILTFGTLAPPVTTTPITPEQAQGMILAAQPVARILLPPGRAVELLNALQQQLALFQQTQQH